MMSHEIPSRPWQIISMDLFNYAGKEHLIIVDHYSDFWEIDLLPDLSAETTIKRCKSQFARYGQPNIVITDNGPQFVSLQFKKFAAEWEFDHITSSPRYPQANGKAESAVKIAKNLCRKARGESSDPWKAILHWRNTPTDGMDSSPAQRLMSRRLKTSLPVANKLLEPVVIQGVPERLRQKRQVAKAKYDRSARDLPELKVGEQIRMRPLPGDRTGRWERGTCLQQVAPRSYLVDVGGTRYRRNRVDLRVAEQPDSSYPVGGSEPVAKPNLLKDNKECPSDIDDSPELAGVSGDSQASEASEYGEQRDPACVRESGVREPVVTRSGRCSRPPDRLNL